MKTAESIHQPSLAAAAKRKLLVYGREKLRAAQALLSLGVISCISAPVCFAYI